MKIIIDTNFILICVKEKIDLFENLKRIFGVYEIILPNQVVSELKNLSENKELKLKEREAAEISVKILKANNATKVESKTKDADTAILDYAKKNKESIIATLDRNLKDKILRSDKARKFLIIKQKKYLVLS